jgi:leader peptidase (prepilin peptidase)/N-methyltransferase
MLLPDMAAPPTLLASFLPSYWYLQHMPVALFVFCFGAIVGSFVNVVVYRLPLGMSVINPPSRCSVCGVKLRFFRENLPILGWFLVRGKCRVCGARVSIEYMLVELFMACSWTALYLLLFAINPREEFWGEVGGLFWQYAGPWRALPAFSAWLVLIAALVAVTLIDARTFTIPLSIPNVVVLTGFAAYFLQALMPTTPMSVNEWPIPTGGWMAFTVSLGGLLGIGFSLIMLGHGMIKRSFADYHEYVKEGETLGDYPHARREVWVEIKFLAPCMLGLMAGYFVGGLMPEEPPGRVIQALTGPMMGYLAGGGIVWAVRILGTLAFGREAMGIGDVHLLGAIGAVLGWFDALLVFFIAPFVAIGWLLLSAGLGKLLKGGRRELPFGPHLAVATLLLMLGRPIVNRAWDFMLHTVPMPETGLIVEEAGTEGPRV